jgi:hypothetical protein
MIGLGCRVLLGQGDWLFKESVTLVNRDRSGYIALDIAERLHVSNETKKKGGRNRRHLPTKTVL